MSALTKQQIYDVLAPVVPANKGTIRGLQINNGHVIFSIEVDPARGPELEDLRLGAEKAIVQLKGVDRVTAVLTAEKSAGVPKPHNDPHSMNKKPKLDLPVKHIVAVASGKGGVGKSTVAFNIAVALAQMGLKTGLLDADIYGPSIPTLAGLQGRKPVTKDGKIQPLTLRVTRQASLPKSILHNTIMKKGKRDDRKLFSNIHIMSIGFMVDQDTPMIWRGPMVQTALYQMLRDVEWAHEDEPLDFLIVDMPPGTGDAQLTMAQKVPLSGAVIVSTPQDLALIDARKGIGMFEKVGVPILGLIENMSSFVCSECGHEEYIFGHGGAQDEAKKRGIDFLGAIPLDIKIRQASDAGELIDINIFKDVASQIAAKVAL